MGTCLMSVDHPWLQSHLNTVESVRVAHALSSISEQTGFITPWGGKMQFSFLAFLAHLSFMSFCRLLFIVFIIVLDN
jgi:hypothetical protein